MHRNHHHHHHLQLKHGIFIMWKHFALMNYVTYAACIKLFKHTVHVYMRTIWCYNTSMVYHIIQCSIYQHSKSDIIASTIAIVYIKLNRRRQKNKNKLKFFQLHSISALNKLIKIYLIFFREKKPNERRKERKKKTKKK